MAKRPCGRSPQKRKGHCTRKQSYFKLAASPPATASSCGHSARFPTGLWPVGVFNVDGPSARHSSPSATKFTRTGLRPVVRSERAYGPWFRRLRRRNIYTVDAGTRAFGPSIIFNGHTARNFVTFFDLFYVCFGKQKRLSWWTVLRPVISSPSATKSPKNNLKLAKTWNLPFVTCFSPFLTFLCMFSNN